MRNSSNGSAASAKKNGISYSAIEEHIDGSQWILPRLAADNRFSDPIVDFALIDGCHGWPTCFVDLEYTNSMLRQGGYLWIDDTELHAVKEMARFLAEQPSFSLVLDLGKSLVFQKPTGERQLGQWVEQPYIVRRSDEYARFPNPFAFRDLRAPRVEHVFAERKDRMGLFIRTIGIARATTKIGIANLVYNIKRLIFLRKIAIACVLREGDPCDLPPNCDQAKSIAGVREFPPSR